MKQSILIIMVTIAIGTGLMSAGCAKIRPILDNIKSTMKRTGEHSLYPLDQTRKRYSCAQEVTRFYVESSELSPGQVSPGSKIKHIVQYALCAPSDSVTVQGMITRNIKFKGKKVKINTGSDTFIFKAGTWTVNAFIEVPDKAPSGNYTLETIIHFEEKTITRSGIFVVR